MELSEVKFEERLISQLSPEIAERIKENMADFCPMLVGQVYMRNQCHNNSILAAKEIKFEGTEIRIVEGLVKCENGFLFEHFWNRIAYGEDICDFDVTLDVIGTEEERNTRKQYYEYFNYSLPEIEERKGNGENAFSPSINDAITEYYENHPLRECYYNSREQVG